MTDPNVQWATYINSNANSIEIQDTWEWWNRFRTFADFIPNIALALEISHELPGSEQLLRWLGEPIDVLIIPKSIFVLDNNQLPVLRIDHKDIVKQFLLKTKCRFALKVNSDEHLELVKHIEYLKHLHQHAIKDDMLP